MKSKKGKKEIIKNGKTVGSFVVNLKDNKVESYIVPTYDTLGNLLNGNSKFVSERTDEIIKSDLSAIYAELKPGDVVEFKNIVALNMTTNKMINLKPLSYTIE